MTKDDNELYQKGLIITNNFSNKPILDSDAYRDAIVKIIKNSYPNFTIGIFGEWGTGKTLLMNSIKQQLQQDKNNVKIKISYLLIELIKWVQ